jgi:DNA-binding protein WhiA
LSFSSLVKEEICRVEDSCGKCIAAQMAAILEINATVEKINDNEYKIKISTENSAFMRKIYSDIKTMTGFHPEVIMKRSTKLKKHRGYTIYLSSNNVLNNILDKTGINIHFEKGQIVKNWTVFKMLNKECCTRTYLRYAFLSGGSMGDPEKSYHLEIASNDKQAIIELSKILNKYDLNSKIIERKGMHICYLKESENIIDFLNIIGAHKALMKIENIRIIKEMRNNVNRIVNCETANLDKTVNAASKQLGNIKYINRVIGLDKLPDSLKQIALLRLENKDLSLKELGELLRPQLGKSGVNHRLRKIEIIAEEIKSGNKQPF